MEVKGQYGCHCLLASSVFLAVQQALLDKPAVAPSRIDSALLEGEIQ